MRCRVLLSVFLLSGSFGFAQEAGQINFINDLAGKKEVTFEQAVKFYLYTLGKAPTNFNADVKALKDLKLLKAPAYEKDRPLRRGMLALMIARHLKIKNSLFFLMFDTRRYAHRACVGAKIMDVDTSEFDLMSGDELIETMAAVSERMEAKK